MYKKKLSKNKNWSNITQATDKNSTDKKIIIDVKKKITINVQDWI